MELADGTRVVVPIERAHMEEDAGKLTHVGGSTGRIQGAEYSLVDYNRAGVPLVEIVTKPIYGTEHRAPEIAKAYVQTIRDIVLALDISDARMERGNLRCDANVSLRPRGQEKLGTRTRDQERELDALGRAGGALRDPASGGDPRRTADRSRRRRGTGTRTPAPPRRAARSPTPTTTATSPSPTCCPSAPSAELIEELRAALPEPPAERRRRLKGEWGFTDLEFQDVANGGLLAEVEATIAAGATPAAARKWWTGEITRIANAHGREAADLVSPADVAALQGLSTPGR